LRANNSTVGRKGRTKPPLEIHADRDGTPAAGVGPGVGLAFVRSVFPNAHERIRIASAYFSLPGYQIARTYIGEGVQIHVLVGREEGAALTRAVLSEINDDLARADADLWDSVSDLVQRMKKGLFTIRDARQIETPFHCKFYVCDDDVMWHGSANYTKSGLQGNAEQASVTRDLNHIRGFTKWYDRVAADAQDLLEPLRQRLEEWLRLAEPFDVYLAALYRLYGLSAMEVAPEAHRPVYYQSAIVARALRQIEEFRGAVAVVATGLGKTVIGCEVAHRLHAAGRITRVVLVAPKSVHGDWQAQLNSRRVPSSAFTPGSVFRRASGPEHHQAAALETQLRLADERTLIILDEAHFARNQLLAEHASRRPSRVFRRLGPPVRSGARILLLTATPYGTNPQNLASLLYMLPDSCPGGLGLAVRWTAGSIYDFIRLPVVTVLGFPHLLDLARKRGDIDDAGRPFIQFQNERRYLPRSLKLRRIVYRPFLESEILSVFGEGCFAQSHRVPHIWADEEGEVHQGVTDSVSNTTIAAWLSSPPSLHDTLARNLATTDGGDQLEAVALTRSGHRSHNGQLEFSLVWDERAPASSYPAMSPASSLAGYGTAMLLPLETRARSLTPLMQRVQQLTPDADHKLTELGKLIWRHCAEESVKAIIFVRKPRTALYLETELRRTFGGTISIASTACERHGKARLRRPVQRVALRERFSPGSHRVIDVKDPLSVLICTDADAEGVSLQDARVVINYDLPDGGDTLFQRAGRVLRLTTDPDRDIYFYTFVPTWTATNQLIPRVRQQVEYMVGRLNRRHAKSASILHAPVLPEGTGEDKSLSVDVETEQFLRDQEAVHGWAGIKVSSPADHLAVLDRNGTRARDLPVPLHSARDYDGEVRRMFVLIQCSRDIIPVVFDVDHETIEARTDLEALDLVACGTDEKRALVLGSDVESLANVAVRKWCDKNAVQIADVRKICAMYLQPRALNQGLPGLFATASKSNRVAQAPF
jgi:hypothetical protein